ncbi:MbtH family NRPS accessory protein [Streptomyces sp. NPDC047028]|uniref:MbtH family NRPS accessory protein n=1 Tax=Streptomyces sp. NPDC047028 TaxID=3155793 RepID=UPI0033D53F4D
MSGVPSAFDPPEEASDGHLVLRSDNGTLSLWPVWRAIPAGWHPVFGPAPHARCLSRTGTYDT